MNKPNRLAKAVLVSRQDVDVQQTDTIYRVLLLLLPVLFLSQEVTPAIAADPPPPHSGFFAHVFLEHADFSSSLPIWQPPTTTIVASKGGGCTGLITDIRWSNHTSMGDYATYMSVTIDGIAHVFFLAAGHETARNVGAVYNEGGVYRLPFGDGLRFGQSFTVRIYGTPFQWGQSTGGGRVSNILVAWRYDTASQPCTDVAPDPAGAPPTPPATGFVPGSPGNLRIQ